MLYRVRQKMKRSRFESLTKGILQTPPLKVVEAPWSIVSMVSNHDVQMYLLSMKSVYARLRRGKLIVIVDRDMPQQLRDTLSGHFPGIQFAILEDIDTGVCQRGGTWERVLYLLDHAKDEYAVQVDCDTLAFGGDLKEALDCIEQNRAFTLNNGERRIEPMAESARIAQTIDTKHICVSSERLFDRYPGGDQLKYVQASSGFAGFAKGGFARARLEEFHQIMDGLIPGRWTEWGTEQVASNFAVANSPNAAVLPFPKYANFEPHVDRAKVEFFHFIGTYRFDDDYFAKMGQKVISELNAA